MALESSLQGPEPAPEPPQTDLRHVEDGGVARHLLGTYGAYGAAGRHLLQAYQAYGLGLPYTQDAGNRRKLHNMEHAPTIGRSEYIGHYGDRHKVAGSYGS